LDPLLVTLDDDAALRCVETVIAEAAEAPGELGRAAAYAVKQVGKRVRARLGLRLCRAWQVPEAEAVTFAAAVELLHNASLVIDDLQDGDLMRRGEASVWRVFGDAQAMNLGLFLLAQAQAVALCIRTQGPGLGPLFTTTLRDASVGQSLEISLRRGGVPDSATYAEIARLKTGSFFRLCAEGAATLARLPAEMVTRTGETFGKLGLLYQMQDDLADTLGLKGREFPGSDLAEGKINAVSLLFLEREPTGRISLTDFYADPAKRACPATRQTWLERFFETGAVAAAQERLRTEGDQLLACARDLPGPVATEFTRLLSRFRDPVLLQRQSGSALVRR
jgi:geranylgeranyl pyrophosphate synthase